MIFQFVNVNEIKYFKEESRMKKQYDGMKAEKVEFNYEENVVASGDNPSNCCGHWDGNFEWANKKSNAKCFPVCTWVHD